MTDEQTPGSGSRWEPAQPPAGDDVPTAQHPASAPASDAASDAGTDRRGRFARLRSRTAVVAGASALGIALLGGVGGFALGHLTAGPGDRIGLVGEGLPGRDGHHPDFDGDGRFHAPPGPPPGVAPNGIPDDEGHGSLGDDDSEQLPPDDSPSGGPTT